MDVQTILSSKAKEEGTIRKAAHAARRICRADADFMEVQALVASLHFVKFDETEQIARAVYAEVR